MAESQKKDSSSVSLKEKNSLLDLDIGKDFLSSWKSMSIQEGDIMDFDLTPVSKGNKKSFDFDKADIDFNLEGDFGKISSFNMDMADLDISPPLKEDGKSKEKSKESSSGKDKGKTDRFAFAFDFDELENFNFEPSITKEGLKAQRDKDDKESSPNENVCLDKDDTMQTNRIGYIGNLDDGPQNPTLPGTLITFDTDFQVGGSSDLQPTRKNCLLNLAMDDAVTSEHSAATDQVASGKGKSPPETTIASRDLPKISESEKLVSLEPVDLEACPGNDAAQDLSSDYLSNNKPSGGNPSEAQEKVDSVDTNATGSNGGDINVPPIVGSTSNYNHIMSENSQQLQPVAISEKNIGKKSQVGVEDHVIDNRERTELGQVNPLVENCFTTSAVSAILGDTPSGRENQEFALETLKIPLVSQPANLLEKETENGREPHVTCSKSFIQSEKPECPLQKVSTQTTFSSLSSKRMGFTQSSVVQGRRDSDGIQSERKLVFLPLQHSKTLFRKEVPQTQIQERCKDLKICREVCSTDGLQNGKKLNDSSTSHNKDMVKTKSALRQRETPVDDLDTLSMDINKKAAQNSRNPTSLAPTPTIRNISLEEQKLSSIEGSRKTPDLCGMKLSGLNLDSTKSPIWKDIKSVGDIGQKKVLLRNTTPKVPDSHKQTPSILSMKRKTLRDDAADINGLHPSKRLSQSLTASRVSVETSEKVLDKKVSNHNKVGDDCSKSTISHCQVSTLSNHNKVGDDRSKSTISHCQVSTLHIPHEVKIKGPEMSFSIENNSNIKQAEDCSKKLDNLCNMLRKKHDEAKEILVQAVVNSNKLLLLNNPLFEEKIRATQKFFARLTLNCING